MFSNRLSSNSILLLFLINTQRFFILTPTELRYYDLDKRLGTIPLSGAQLLSIASDNSATDDALIFSVVTPTGYTLVMRADTTSRCNIWKSYIQLQIDVLLAITNKAAATARKVERKMLVTAKNMESTIHHLASFTEFDDQEEEDDEALHANAVAQSYSIDVGETVSESALAVVSLPRGLTTTETARPFTAGGSAT